MALGTNAPSVMKSVGVIAKLAAGTLVDNLVACRLMEKADKSDYDGKNGYKAGDTIQINVPALYTPGTSFDITSSIQAIQETRIPLVLDIIQTVGVDVDSRELAYQIGMESLYNRVIKPAVEGIAQGVENICLTRACSGVANIVGTAGSTTFDTATVLAAGQKMTEFLAPRKDRSILLNPGSEASAVNARKGFVNQATQVGKQYISGAMGSADGFDYYSNNLLPRFTSGTATGAHTVTTTSVAGATTLAITGTGTQTLTAGQTFTVAGCNAVHPQTKVDLGYLKQFVITANATAAAGAYTVTIGEPIYTATSGSLQNITRFPTASDVITLGAGTGNTLSTIYPQNLAFHKQAFRMVSVPLVMPEAVEMSAQETYEGVTVAVVRAFDVRLRSMITRIDFLGGFAVTRPMWACRIPA
jgi:uncharacterized protein YaiE (UPF0345 family)